MGRKKKKKRNQLTVRSKVLAVMKARYPGYIFKSNLLGCFFGVGAVLAIIEIDIYRETFIPVYIPLGIWLLTGALITPFFKKVFNIYCFNPYTPGRTSMFFHYLYNIIAFGGTLVFLFMWTNQVFRDKEKTVINLPIISSGHFARSKNGCEQPYVYVKYREMEKQLVFNCQTEVEKYEHVYAEVSTGLWGFEVIERKSLENENW